MIAQKDFEYAVAIRRKIHRHPEIGFDLPETARLVREELDKMGVAHSEAFAPCSVVGYIGNDPAKKTLALRADMDALPVEEKVDLPFKSELPGKMHACGHDTHTAILLTVARILKEKEKELPCNVRLLFQPSEECEESGAKLMTENGAVDGADAVVCTHCEPMMPVGHVGVARGDYMAACMPFTIRFFGRTSHAAAAPEKGIDAIKMAVRAFHELSDAVKAAFGGEKYIWNVGVFQGGTAHNVIADYCELKATFRYFDQTRADAFRAEAGKILDKIAADFGGRVEWEAPISSHPSYNDPALVDAFRRVMAPFPEPVVEELGTRMSSEDFNWYLQKVPGFIFRYGVRNEKEGCDQPAHSNCFKVDENGMKYAVETFLRVVENFR
ncbi:MAG: amidohydrolase [Clostridia bacterium]|nr:amidohydrolase [Clostridia bacterium]